MKKIILILSVLLATNASAAWFASSYEDCLNDGKIGRSNAEFGALRQACRAKFPKLPNLYNQKNANFVCKNKDWSFSLKTKGNDIYRNEDKEILLGPLTLKIKGTVRFESDKLLSNPTTHQIALLKFDINTLTGYSRTEIIIDGKSDALFFECEETN